MRCHIQKKYGQSIPTGSRPNTLLRIRKNGFIHTILRFVGYRCKIVVKLKTTTNYLDYTSG